MEKYDDYKMPSKENVENLKHAYSNIKVSTLNDETTQNVSITSGEDVIAPNDKDNANTAPIANPRAPISPVTKPIKFNLFLMYAMISLLSGYNCGR